MSETFGQVVRRLRRGRGWSQEQLGVKAGLDQSTVSQVELDKGERTAETVKRLASALGQPQAVFLRLAGIIDDAVHLEMTAVPVPPTEGDRPFDPVQIVAFVESKPDELFQSDLARERLRRTVESYTRLCLRIYKAWTSNAELVMGELRVVEYER